MEYFVGYLLPENQGDRESNMKFKRDHMVDTKMLYDRKYLYGKYSCNLH